MKPIIFFFALSFFAAAQTLVGPNTGPVFLKGTPSQPILANHSGKVILSAVLVTHAANGFVASNNIFFGADPAGGKLVKNGEERDHLLFAISGQRIKVAGYNSISPIVSVDLDLVIFTDGEMIGPDKSKSEAESLERIKRSTHSAITLWRAK